MDGSHPVKLFRHGEGHAVDIPAGFTLPGEDAVMRQEGQRLIIEPGQRMSTAAELVEFLKTLKPIDERLATFDDPPPRPFQF